MGRIDRLLGITPKRGAKALSGSVPACPRHAGRPSSTCSACAEALVKGLQELMAARLSAESNMDSVYAMIQWAREAWKAEEFEKCERLCLAAYELQLAGKYANFGYPYERLAMLYEKQGRLEEALRFATEGKARFGVSTATLRDWNKRIARLKRKIAKRPAP